MYKRINVRALLDVVTNIKKRLITIIDRKCVVFAFLRVFMIRETYGTIYQNHDCITRIITSSN